MLHVAEWRRTGREGIEPKAAAVDVVRRAHGSIFVETNGDGVDDSDRRDILLENGS